MTKIFLVRHGESVLNKKRLINGHADTPLTVEGREQAQVTRQELADIKFDDAYSSDLMRATETAEIIYGRPVAKNHQLFDLRERYMGSLERKNADILDDEHKIRQDLSHEENWTYKHVPDMESNQEIATRFVGALRKIAQDNPGKTVLVVGHGAAIRAIIMKLKGLGYLDVPNGSFKNAGFVELDYDDRGDNLLIVKTPGLKTA